MPPEPVATQLAKWLRDGVINQGIRDMADVVRVQDSFARSYKVGAILSLIALTGWGQDEDKQMAEQAGFDEHWTKPVDPQRLQGLIP